MPSPNYTGTRVVHIKLTDPTGKHPVVINEHFVWDKDRFVAAQRIRYNDEPRSRGNIDEIREVTVAMPAEYAAYRNKGRKAS